jgi:hypothetical protein
MLLNFKDFYGRKLAAIDGLIGHVRDFYFDDKAWALRYVVADTGSWLLGRLVLLSPQAFVDLDHRGKTLHVKLHVKQIANSPSIDKHKPVSRQFEEDYHRYYAWPGYWLEAPMLGAVSYSEVMPPSQDLPDGPGASPRGDPHLQSAKSITGYHIEATDGAIGHVGGFLMDDKAWGIHNLVVEAGPWNWGKEILISPSKIERISHEESKVYVRLTKADIQRTDENELARVGSEAHGADNFRD